MLQSETFNGKWFHSFCQNILCSPLACYHYMNTYAKSYVFGMVCALLCFVLVSYRLILPVSYRITSLALEQSYHCPNASEAIMNDLHDDVIKWKHFPRYWPYVQGIHRSPVNSPHKDQWCGALMFSLICVWINGWVNNREAGDLRRCRAHYDVTVMGLVYHMNPRRTDEIATTKWSKRRTKQKCTFYMINSKVLLGACSR